MKIEKSFYLKPALDVAKEFLGKKLVYNSEKGLVSGIISEVEAYPAFIDDVSHGNRRTPRTEIMYKEGGYAYVYLIYGLHYQLAVVVNKKDIPDVVFIRAVIPKDGIEIMRLNFDKGVKKVSDLTKSPGNLCKSFGITLSLYGEDLTGDKLYLENAGDLHSSIKSAKRVGINSRLKGNKNPYRYLL
ncbi:DNA-3-methyladenine glycosylase [Patescibacteria group bacterium]|nr:DNA-3-methyladenine glycosylase [Patescibacteria group bacterium]